MLLSSYQHRLSFDHQNTVRAITHSLDRNLHRYIRRLICPIELRFLGQTHRMILQTHLLNLALHPQHSNHLFVNTCRILLRRLHSWARMTCRHIHWLTHRLYLSRLLFCYQSLRHKPNQTTLVSHPDSLGGVCGHGGGHDGAGGHDS